MPREIRVVSDLPRTVQDSIAAGNEVRGAREELQNQSVAALARLDAIVSGGAQYTPDQVRDAVVDIAGVVRRVSRVLRAT